MNKFIKNNLVIIIVLAASVVVALSLPFVQGKQVMIPFVSAPTPTVTPAPLVTEFSYKGETGKDALTILKAKAPIEQAASGLVVSINGRKAQDAKHEFWGFYVNGEMAQVGPADYQTKDTDTILWKIEKY